MFVAPRPLSSVHHGYSLSPQRSLVFLCDTGYYNIMGWWRAVVNAPLTLCWLNASGHLLSVAWAWALKLPPGGLFSQVWGGHLNWNIFGWSIVKSVLVFLYIVFFKRWSLYLYTFENACYFLILLFHVIWRVRTNASMILLLCNSSIRKLILRNLNCCQFSICILLKKRIPDKTRINFGRRWVNPP